MFKRTRVNNGLQEDDVRDENCDAVECEQVVHSEYCEGLPCDCNPRKIYKCRVCKKTEVDENWSYGCFVDGSRVGEHKLYGEERKIDVRD